MNKSIVFFLGILLILSCQQVADKSEAVSIPVTLEEKELKLSSLFDSYQIIKLSGRRLMQIKDIIDIGEGYVVSGRSEGSDINLFDKNGRFISPIINKGKAKNEYSWITDVYFDKEANALYILDFNQSIMVYDLDEKKVVERFKLPFSVNSVTRLDDDRFVLYDQYGNFESSENQYKVYIYNTKTALIEAKYLPRNAQTASYTSTVQQNNLYKKAGDIIFYEAYHDSGYRINKDSISTYFTFDKGELTFTEKLLHAGYKDLRGFRNVCINSNAIWFQGDCFEYKENLFSVYRYGERGMYMNVANLSTKTSNSYTAIHDDLIMNTILDLFVYRLIATDQGGIYFTLEPSALQEHYPKYAENKALADIKEDDNTLVIRFK